MAHLERMLERAMDILFPRSARDAELEALTAPALVRMSEPAFPPERAGFEAYLSYKDPTVRRLIWLFKYKRSGRAARLFGALLSERLLAELADDALFASGGSRPLLVPIPMTRARDRARGGNHLERLSEAALEAGLSDFVEYAPRALTRTRETPPQASIRNRRRREENVAGVFSPAFPDRLAGRLVYLIDDVATTGATLREAKRALKEGGAKRVRPIAIAH